MKNLLKQIVNNTEPKRSFSIVVSNNKTKLKKHGSSHQFNWIKRKIMNSTHESGDVLLISKYR